MRRTIDPKKPFYLHANVTELNGDMNFDWEIPSVYDTQDEALQALKDTEDEGYVIECRVIYRALRGPRRITAVKVK